MDRIPSALAWKVGDEEVHRWPGSLFVTVDAKEKISWAQHLKGLIIDSHVGSFPVSELLGKGWKRQARRKHLPARSSLQKDRGDDQQKSNGEKTRDRPGHSFAPAFCRLTVIRPCRAYSITREMTKMIHPHEAWK